MKKHGVRFILWYVRIKTHILNFILWPYVYCDFDELMKKDKEKITVTKRLPE